MSLPVTAEPLPSSYAFGKVIGRIVHLIADTAEDTDDKPQARAAAGTVTFTPKDVLRKTSDADYPAIVLHSPETATLSSSGRILDAEGRQGVWLAIGAYTASFAITGASRASIPSFDIQVTTEHTDAAPLDLATVVPYVPPTGTVVQTIVVPSGGTAVQVLVRTVNGQLVWADQSGGTGGTGAVASVNGKTGTVVLSAADIGLGSVDNTSDASKPVSTAQQAALNAKVTGTGISEVRALTQATYDALGTKVATTLYVITGA